MEREKESKLKIKMKRVMVFLGMGSCVSADQTSVNPDTSSLDALKLTPPQKPILHTLQSLLVFQKTGSREEVFFDSKAWLESDDEDFLSLNGDYSPEHRQMNKINGTDDYNPYEQKKNREHKAGRRLSDLFRDSNSFSSDSQTSVKAANGDQAMSRRDNCNEENKQITTPKLMS